MSRYTVNRLPNGLWQLFDRLTLTRTSYADEHGIYLHHRSGPDRPQYRDEVAACVRAFAVPTGAYASEAY